MSRKRIVHSSEDSLSPPEKQVKKEFWEDRAKRLETGYLSDCQIIVEDKTILTHKYVLAYSPYFESKFDSQSNFKEDERDRIKISNYKYEIVYEMIKYIYTLKVKISTENAQDLLNISNEYQIMGLFERAQKFIVDRIETENVLDWLIWTEHITNATLLKSASIDHVLDHYFVLQATEQWKELSWDLGREIFHHKMLNERITDINAENADKLLEIAKKHHVKKLTMAVQKFKNRV